ncbi:MAG: dihydrofolate reductase family protein, partial [Pseudomonadales bacterium]|nr:dihydrofolate reductase family protein [Pseudomonadales bacterium]
NGVSQWITGPAARADVQRLRARSSAILTGSGTVLADDPALTVRDLDALGEWAERPLRQPLRVVVDSQLRTPPGARLLHEAGETLIFTRQPLDEARAAQLRDRAHVRIEAIAATTGQGVDLDAVLQRLAALQCNELLAECGPRLAGNLVQQGLVDELWIYLAPLLLGSAARPLLQLPAIERMADRWPLLIDEIRPLGDDWRIRARFDHAAHATQE